MVHTSASDGKNTKKNITKVPKVGRPKKYETENLLRRNLTVSDAGWDGFEKIAKNHGLSSRSELFDQIGRGQKQVVFSEQSIQFFPIDEIPVLPRLLSLIKKTAYLKSLLSFARLVSLQTGLIKELYDNEKMIEKIVTQAIAIVALRNYIYPDDHTNSALADIRWIIFRLLISLASAENSQENLLSDRNESIEDIKTKLCENYQNKSIETNVFNILCAIELLSKNYLLQYQIYEMRMIESLTWEQIYRLFKLRDSNLTEEQIRKENHKAVDAIRDAWHTIESGQIKNNRQDIEKTGLFEEMKDSLGLAQSYYNIFANVSTRQGNIELITWESFLLTAMQEPKLDLLLPEIHHSWVHDMCKAQNIDLDEYKDRNDQIIKNINDDFTGYLKTQLNLLKKNLKFCGNKKQDIQDTLMTFVNSDLTIGIPELYFLGNRLTQSQRFKSGYSSI